jgi:hypothetical protein
MSKTLKSLADNAYWRAEDAREALDELARSGLPLEVFAKKNRLGAARLRRWQCQLGKPSSFVKLEVDEPLPARPMPITIRISDVTIEVAVVDVELLTAVVKAVRCSETRRACRHRPSPKGARA